MNKKKRYLQLARAIPSTLDIKDFEAKRVIDALAEILRRLLMEDRETVVSLPQSTIALLAGTGIEIESLPNNTSKISATETGSESSIVRYIGLNSVKVDGSSILLQNDSETPGNDKVYGTDASGNRGWKDDSAGLDLTSVCFGYSISGADVTIYDGAILLGNNTPYYVGGNQTRTITDNNQFIGVEFTWATMTTTIGAPTSTEPVSEADGSVYRKALYKFDLTDGVAVLDKICHMGGNIDLTSFYADAL